MFLYLDSEWPRYPYKAIALAAEIGHSITAHVKLRKLHHSPLVIVLVSGGDAYPSYRAKATSHE